MTTLGREIVFLARLDTSHLIKTMDEIGREVTKPLSVKVDFNREELTKFNRQLGSTSKSLKKINSIEIDAPFSRAVTSVQSLNLELKETLSLYKKICEAKCCDDTPKPPSNPSQGGGNQLPPASSPASPTTPPSQPKSPQGGGAIAQQKPPTVIVETETATIIEASNRKVVAEQKSLGTRFVSGFSLTSQLIQDGIGAYQAIEALRGNQYAQLITILGLIEKNTGFGALRTLVEGLIGKGIPSTIYRTVFDNANKVFRTVKEEISTLLDDVFTGATGKDAKSYTKEVAEDIKIQAENLKTDEGLQETLRELNNGLKLYAKGLLSMNVEQQKNAALFTKAMAGSVISGATHRIAASTRERVVAKAQDEVLDAELIESIDQKVQQAVSSNAKELVITIEDDATSENIAQELRKQGLTEGKNIISVSPQLNPQGVGQGVLNRGVRSLQNNLGLGSTPDAAYTAQLVSKIREQAPDLPIKLVGGKEGSPLVGQVIATLNAQGKGQNIHGIGFGAGLSLPFASNMHSYLGEKDYLQRSLTSINPFGARTTRTVSGVDHPTLAGYLSDSTIQSDIRGIGGFETSALPMKFDQSTSPSQRIDGFLTDVKNFTQQLVDSTPTNQEFVARGKKTMEGLTDVFLAAIPEKPVEELLAASEKAKGDIQAALQPYVDQAVKVSAPYVDPVLAQASAIRDKAGQITSPYTAPVWKSMRTVGDAWKTAADPYTTQLQSSIQGFGTQIRSFSKEDIKRIPENFSMLATDIKDNVSLGLDMLLEDPESAYVLAKTDMGAMADSISENIHSIGLKAKDVADVVGGELEAMAFAAGVALPTFELPFKEQREKFQSGWNTTVFPYTQASVDPDVRRGQEMKATLTPFLAVARESQMIASEGLDALGLALFSTPKAIADAPANVKATKAGLESAMAAGLDPALTQKIGKFQKGWDNTSFPYRYASVDPEIRFGQEIRHALDPYIEIGKIGTDLYAGLSSSIQGGLDYRQQERIANFQTGWNTTTTPYLSASVNPQIRAGQEFRNFANPAIALGQDTSAAIEETYSRVTTGAQGLSGYLGGRLQDKAVDLQFALSPVKDALEPFTMPLVNAGKDIADSWDMASLPLRERTKEKASEIKTNVGDFSNEMIERGKEGTEMFLFRSDIARDKMVQKVTTALSNLKNSTEKRAEITESGTAMMKAAQKRVKEAYDKVHAQVISTGEAFNRRRAEAKERLNPQTPPPIPTSIDLSQAFLGGGEATKTSLGESIKAPTASKNFINRVISNSIQPLGEGDASAQVKATFSRRRGNITEGLDRKGAQPEERIGKKVGKAFLKGFDETMGIQSPSRAMMRRMKDIIAGMRSKSDDMTKDAARIAIKTGDSFVNNFTATTEKFGQKFKTLISDTTTQVNSAVNQGLKNSSTEFNFMNSFEGVTKQDFFTNKGKETIQNLGSQASTLFDQMMFKVNPALALELDNEDKFDLLGQPTPAKSMSAMKERMRRLKIASIKGSSEAAHRVAEQGATIGAVSPDAYFGAEEAPESIQQARHRGKQLLSAVKIVGQSALNAAKALGKEMTADLLDAFDPTAGIKQRLKDLAKSDIDAFSGEEGDRLREQLRDAEALRVKLRATSEELAPKEGRANMIGTLAEAVPNILPRIAITQQLVSLIPKVMEVTRQFNQLKLSLQAAVGSSAEEHFVRLRKAAADLGLNLVETIRGFASLSAAAVGTDLAPQIEEIHANFAKAFASMQLSGEKQVGVYTALSQMISKGTVTAEELSGQLGEHLPGALSVAAKAMNVTTQELLTMVKTGKVTAEQMLPALAEQLGRTAEIDLASRMETSSMALSSLEATFMTLATNIGRWLEPALKYIYKFLNALAKIASSQAELFLIGFIGHSVLLGKALLTVANKLGLVTAAKKLMDLAFDKTYQAQMLKLGAIAVLGATALKQMGTIYKYLFQAADKLQVSSLRLSQTLKENITQIRNASNMPVEERRARGTNKQFREDLKHLHSLHPKRVQADWEEMWDVILMKGAMARRQITVFMDNLQKELELSTDIRMSLTDRTTEGFIKRTGQRVVHNYSQETREAARQAIDEITAEIGGVKLELAIALDQNETRKVAKLREELKSLREEQRDIKAEAFPHSDELGTQLETLEKRIKDTRNRIKVLEEQGLFTYASMARNGLTYLVQEREKVLELVRKENDALKENVAIYTQLTRQSELATSRFNVIDASPVRSLQQIELLRKRINHELSQKDFDRLSSQQETNQLGVNFVLKTDTVSKLEKEVKQALDTLGETTKTSLLTLLGVEGGTLEEALEKSLISASSIATLMSTETKATAEALGDPTTLAPILKALQNLLTLREQATQAELDYLNSINSVSSTSKQNLSELRGFVRAVEDLNTQIEQFKLTRARRLTQFALEVEDLFISSGREVRDYVTSINDLGSSLRSQILQAQQDFDTARANLEVLTSVNELRGLLNDGADGFFSSFTDLVSGILKSEISTESELDSIAKTRLEAEKEILTMARQIRDLRERGATIERERVKNLLRLKQSQEDFVREQEASWRAIARQIQDMTLTAKQWGIEFETIAELLEKVSQKYTQLANSVPAPVPMSSSSSAFYGTAPTKITSSFEDRRYPKGAIPSMAELDVPNLLPVPKGHIPSRQRSNKPVPPPPNAFVPKKPVVYIPPVFVPKGLPNAPIPSAFTEKYGSKAPAPVPSSPPASSGTPLPPPPKIHTVKEFKTAPQPIHYYEPARKPDEYYERNPHEKRPPRRAVIPPEQLPQYSPVVPTEQAPPPPPSPSPSKPALLDVTIEAPPMPSVSPTPMPTLPEGTFNTTPTSISETLRQQLASASPEVVREFISYLQRRKTVPDALLSYATGLSGLGNYKGAIDLLADQVEEFEKLKQGFINFREKEVKANAAEAGLNQQRQIRRLLINQKSQTRSLLREYQSLETQVTRLTSSSRGYLTFQETFSQATEDTRNQALRLSDSLVQLKTRLKTSLDISGVANATQFKEKITSLIDQVRNTAVKDDLTNALTELMAGREELSSFTGEGGSLDILFDTLEAQSKASVAAKQRQLNLKIEQEGLAELISSYTSFKEALAIAGDDTSTSKRISMLQYEQKYLQQIEELNIAIAKYGEEGSKFYDEDKVAQLKEVRDILQETYDFTRDEYSIKLNFDLNKQNLSDAKTLVDSLTSPMGIQHGFGTRGRLGMLSAELNTRSQYLTAEQSLRQYENDPAMQGLIPPELIQEASTLLREDYANALLDARIAASQLGQTIQSPLQTAISSSITGLISGTTTLKDILRSFLDSIAKSLADFAAKMISNQIMRWLFGGLGGLFGGGLGGGFGSILTGGAGTISSGLSIANFSEGGMVGVGQYFSNSNGMASTAFMTGFNRGIANSGLSGGGLATVGALTSSLFGGNYTGGIMNQYTTSNGTNLSSLWDTNSFDVSNFKNGGNVSSSSSTSSSSTSNSLANNIQNFNSGGKVLQLGLGVMKAMKREGANAVPIVAHRGEQVLSTRNNDAQTYRALYRSGVWNQLKQHTAKKTVSNYSYGGLVGDYTSRFSQSSNSLNNAISRNSSNVTYNMNISTPDANSFRKSRSMLAQEERLILERSNRFN